MSNSFQSIAFDAHSRRFLLHNPLYNQPSYSDLSPTDARESSTPGSSFDANVVMILAVLLCALICALGLNSVVRCALRCSNRSAVEPHAEPVAQHKAWMRRKALRSLPTLVYSAGINLSGTGSECAICLSEFVAGERIRVLPECKHGFHVHCVDRWLLARPSCPTCRQGLFSSSEKFTAQVIVVPLEPEGFNANYR